VELMSIFASRTQQTIAIPFDVPHTVTVQKLSGLQLEAAYAARLTASTETLKRMGGAAFRDDLAALGDSTAVAALVAQAQADPLTHYDRTTVLEKGIVGWSYDGAPTRALIEDLSQEAATFLARAILALTLPPQDEASRKNASGSSTAV
jgi:hypothetical protein